MGSEDRAFRAHPGLKTRNTGRLGTQQCQRAKRRDERRTPLTLTEAEIHEVEAGLAEGILETHIVRSRPGRATTEIPIMTVKECRYCLLEWPCKHAAWALMKRATRGAKPVAAEVETSSGGM